MLPIADEGASVKEGSNLCERAFCRTKLSLSPPILQAAEFRLADRQNRGFLELAEFEAWLKASGTAGGREQVAGPVTRKQLMQVGLLAGVPMVGFGFVDNVIMVPPPAYPLSLHIPATPRPAEARLVPVKT